MRRRTLLAALGGGLTGFAGCAGLSGDGTDRTTYGVPGTTSTRTRSSTQTPRATPSTGERISVSYVVRTTDSPAYRPGRVRIEPGDSVRWPNTGESTHTVTARIVPHGADYFASGEFADEASARDGYPEGAIGPGDSYSHTFEVEGVYDYFCIPHEDAGMWGRIGVGVSPKVPGDGPSPDVRMSDRLQFFPESLRVPAGTEVVWATVGNQPHSVTAYGDGIPDGADYWASGGFGSESLAREAWPDGAVEPGDRFAHAFSSPGTHRYFCIPHEGAGMTGTVEVLPADGGGTPDPADGTTTTAVGPGEDQSR